MEKKLKTAISLTLTLFCLQSNTLAQIVTQEEAKVIASKWIYRIIYYYGKWGNSPSAEIEAVQDFKRGDRVIGYFCKVRPQGFIVTSLRRELPPIKAYSYAEDLSPDSDKGFADVIKIGLERAVNAIEQKTGPIKLAKTEAIEAFCKTDYRKAWDMIEKNENLRKQEDEIVSVNGYTPGNPLLNSKWGQDYPYNDACPNHAKVGCVAVAAAQIMNYYSWPPWGEGIPEDPYNDAYDWNNMFDWCKRDGNTWKAENGKPLEQSEIDAVAELCYEAGYAAGTDYGSIESTAYLWKPDAEHDMLSAFENHFYFDEDADYSLRVWILDSDWYDMIKRNINDNQPMQYGILTDLDVGLWPPGVGTAAHSMVLDGYREDVDGREIHLNYGWAGSFDNWYNIEDIEKSTNENLEMVLHDLKPRGLLSPILAGTYEPGYHRNVIWNVAAIEAATFLPGSVLQLLPGVKISNFGLGIIEFNGTMGKNTQLGSRNTHTRPIAWTYAHIYNGSLKLYNGGEIKFFK